MVYTLCCPKCKKWLPEKEFEGRKWCPNCRRVYSERLANLGKARVVKNPPEVIETHPLKRIVKLAERSGQLKAQATIYNNKWKWTQWYANEAQLKKEMEKWLTFNPTSH